MWFASPFSELCFFHKQHNCKDEMHKAHSTKPAWTIVVFFFSKLFTAEFLIWCEQLCNHTAWKQPNKKSKNTSKNHLLRYAGSDLACLRYPVNVRYTILYKWYIDIYFWYLIHISKQYNDINIKFLFQFEKIIASTHFKVKTCQLVPKQWSTTHAEIYMSNNHQLFAFNHTAPTCKVKTKKLKH